MLYGLRNIRIHEYIYGIEYMEYTLMFFSIDSYIY